MRFYSQFWKVRESESKKETFVANALLEFYRLRRTPTICIGNIRKKVKREVEKLSKILKFKSKEKTNQQTQIENEYRLTLSNVFSIEKPYDVQTTQMEIDEDFDLNGILFQNTNMIYSYCNLNYSEYRFNKS